MITIAEQGNAYTLYLLSTDEKPHNLPNGAACLEMDTGKVFMYDKAGDSWKEI